MDAYHGETMTITVDRTTALAWRAMAHGLAESPTDAVLATGLQDYPPGRTAHAALRVRIGREPDPSTVALVHSTRAALHLHRRDDLALLAAALRVDDGRALDVTANGRFGVELAEAGISHGAAIDQVAHAMAAVMADGRALTKGELSGAVSPMVDSRLAPWCPGCAVNHVHDALFRAATLQAGLAAEVTTTPTFRYVRLGLASRPDRDRARAELVRRFVHLAGPTRPVRLASWLALTPPVARTWWDLVADELRPLTIAGTDFWMTSDDAERLATLVPVTGVRLLLPYDPLLELADRELLVPDAAARRQVWAASANPGALLVDGEIAGVWRHRSTGGRLVVTVTTFATPPPPRRLASALADAETVAASWGLADVELRAMVRA